MKIETSVKRKKYSRIDYKDSAGVSISKHDLAEKYGIGHQSVTRAFSAHNGDYKKANAYLTERHLVPIADRLPETYIRKDYRDKEGHSIERKECATLMGLKPQRVGKLYERYDNDWRFIYATFGIDQIVNRIIKKKQRRNNR